MDPSVVARQDRVLELFLQFWVARGVMAAIEMDVFEHCAGEGLPFDELRARLGLEERPARALIDLCVATGLLARAGDRVVNTPDAADFLFSGSEYSVRNYALDERWCWDKGWGQLDTLLRENRQALPPDEDGYHAFPADYFLDFLHGHTLAMASVLASSVDLSGVGSLIDVGGGSGATSIALCRAFPSLRATVIDQEPVLVKTRAHIASAGLADRISTAAVNFFEGDLPGADAAVISSVLHDFAPDRVVEILGRVHAALEPGGRLFVMELVPNDERSAPVLPVAFALTMLVNTAGGDAHTGAQYRAWMDECGFDVVREIELGGKLVTKAFEAVRR